MTAYDNSLSYDYGIHYNGGAFGSSPMIYSGKKFRLRKKHEEKDYFEEEKKRQSEFRKHIERTVSPEVEVPEVIEAVTVEKPIPAAAPMIVNHYELELLLLLGLTP